MAQKQDTDADSVPELGESISSSFLKLRDTLSTYKYNSPTKGSGPNNPTAPITQDVDYSTMGSPSFKRECSSGLDGEVLPQLATRSKSNKRLKRGYAPPETYEHLHYLQDYLEPYLDVVFCGINPGYMSGQTGYHYAHSTNHFWHCLHLSGLTERLLSPEEAPSLLETYHFGLTNLVDRPTAEQSELSTEEMNGGVPVLMDKLVKYRPKMICFLGKGIWEVFRKQAFTSQASTSRDLASVPSSEPLNKDIKRTSTTPRVTVASKYFIHIPKTDERPPQHASSPSISTKQKAKPFEWGLQPYKVVYKESGDAPLPMRETLIFVVPSPSARVVAYQWWDKVKFFESLREHVAAMHDRKIDTSRFTPVPLRTTKSIYFTNPPESACAA
ncbi:DNA glycosylase [Trametopsis cervina]|nr:DNA glycosylase [Trametopsis cervina]